MEYKPASFGKAESAAGTYFGQVMSSIPTRTYDRVSSKFLILGYVADTVLSRHLVRGKIHLSKLQPYSKLHMT